MTIEESTVCMTCGDNGASFTVPTVNELDASTVRFESSVSDRILAGDARSGEAAEMCRESMAMFFNEHAWLSESKPLESYGDHQLIFRRACSALSRLLVAAQLDKTAEQNIARAFDDVASIAMMTAEIARMALSREAWAKQDGRK